MMDSFTRVLPGYNHEARTGYTTAISHKLHPEYKESIDHTPITEINRAFTKKSDV